MQKLGRENNHYIIMNQDGHRYLYKKPIYYTLEMNKNGNQMKIKFSSTYALPSLPFM
jgi:hypothetical protein